MLAAPLAAAVALSAPACSRGAAQAVIASSPVIVPASESISSEP